MTEMMILDKPIRQVVGLYCLNDLHRASGGESRHKPSNWLQSQQVTEFIDYLSKSGNPDLKQNQEVIQIIHGGNMRGTYGNRKVALAYATWISPEFFSLVLDTFDAVAFGHGQISCSTVTKIKPCGDYPPPLPHSYHTQMLPPPPQNLAEARALFAKIDRDECNAQTAYLEAIKAKEKMEFVVKETRSWRDYWVRVEAYQAID